MNAKRAMRALSALLLLAALLSGAAEKVNMNYHSKIEELREAKRRETRKKGSSFQQASHPDADDGDGYPDGDYGEEFERMRVQMDEFARQQAAQVAAPTAEQVRWAEARRHMMAGAGVEVPEAAGRDTLEAMLRGAEMASVRAVAELSLANRLPNLRKEEFLDLVPALLAARGPDGALVSKFAVAFNVSCARWAAAYDVREEFRDNGCQLRPGT